MKLHSYFNFYLLKTFLAGVLFIFTVSNVYAGLKVVIDTKKPTSDFVVRCQWHSDFMNFHGGKKLVSERVHIASSGEVVDCGGNLYGDASVDIMHPLYLSVTACAYGEICNSPYQTIKDGVVHVRPVSMYKNYDHLVHRYKRNDIQITLPRFMGNFNDHYFRYYRKVKSVDMDYFRKTYTRELEDYYRMVKDYVGDARPMPEPGRVVNNFWKRNSLKKQQDY